LAYGATIEDLLDDIAERLNAWPREALSKSGALDVSHPNTIQIATRVAAITSLRPRRAAIAIRCGHSWCSTSVPLCQHVPLFVIRDHFAIETRTWARSSEAHSKPLAIACY